MGLNKVKLKQIIMKNKTAKEHLAQSEFKKKEANELIKIVAEMVEIETDGLGYDDLQLSLNDFLDTISKLRGGG